MNKKMKVAAIQMNSAVNKEQNVRHAVELVREAAAQSAEFICLPETFNYRGDTPNPSKEGEDIPGPSLFPLIEIAHEHKVWILAGSIYEKIKGNKKVYNTSVLINPQGKVETAYRKCHLFDVKVRGKQIKESGKFKPGTKTVMTKVSGISTGLSVCYDLRFPEMYRKYADQGAMILCAPSAFTYSTGEVHWDILLRARAIENSCFVIAPNQTGIGPDKIRSYGHSMIIDPWGRVLAQATANETQIIYAVLDFKILAGIRSNFPVLKHRTIK